jgi:hypothetical protein
MENFKTADNPQHNAVYEFGFIQGIKLTLQKLSERVEYEKDPATGGHYVVILSVLLNHTNSMPTVIECGKFRLNIEDPKNRIAFDWIESKKEQMLNLLNS